MNGLKAQIAVTTNKKTADLVLRNCKLVNVLTSEIYSADIVIFNGMIVDVIERDSDNFYEVKADKVIDVEGKYAIPGLIEGHIHIESSFVTPEEFARLVIPHGTTTLIADPHEIVNVCGRDGMEYMLKASGYTKLDIKYMIPSCVPATPFENSGAIIDYKDVCDLLEDDRIIGLGEFMNAAGVINNDGDCIKKISGVRQKNKIIDGHAPNITGRELSAYIGTGIKTDHECQKVQQMQERLRKGMHVILRQGSACSDLRELLKGVNEKNYHQCLLCSDDRQPVTILEEGHLDHHLRICVQENIDPIMAVQMATINAANCYGLHDRGAIAPGKRADICIVEDLKDFKVHEVFILGELVAKDGEYLHKVIKAPIGMVSSSVDVKDFSKDKLKLNLREGVVNNNRVYVNAIGVQAGSIVTKKDIVSVLADDEGNFVFDPQQDVAKICVVERHNRLGNVGVGFIKGFGIKEGAIASTYAHDSHNIIAIGTNDSDIEYAVNKLIKQQGGVVVAKNNRVVDCLKFNVAGLMSEETGEIVMLKLDNLYKNIKQQLGLNDGIDGVMTLAFMALPVIPELKITDKGLFDVNKMEFIPVCADSREFELHMNPEVMANLPYTNEFEQNIFPN